MGADARFYERLGPLTAAEIADAIDGRVAGDGDAPVDNVAAPASAEARDLFFLTTIEEDGRAPSAGVAIGPADLAARLDGLAAVIVHDSPKTAFAKAAPLIVRPRRHLGDALIHPDARIADGADVGPGCAIGPDAEIAEGAWIGPGAVIGPGVTVGRGTRIGARAVLGFCLIGEGCEISAGAVIGESGFGLAQADGALFTLPHMGRVIIEDDVTLGANVTVDRGMFIDTVLRRSCRIDNLSHIAHNVEVGEHAVMAAFAGVSGSVTVGRGVQFGGRVGVADHLSIGENARLAADAAIMRDVPAGETWAGSPGQPISRFMREVAWIRRESARRPAKRGSKDET
ncbi:UDP-3-O-(3-hydroxymyristoyl)glucosamine N-acyltransferase [Marinicauda salina]|uniref:UDP-3-O-(3-hydroxymyristoyl)glucosamine N-acyltransferase n=1 Tax=Marinicauda salina TaxID=2135793 RepID=A0A2U2BT95_9PROT|nr:UDP-3-O-(3-hydroxymyristoyl)glucosamine N-acyltransferase [Marinicauda salina]PWE17239.1 UDP-3-O-(3-hydroxymyristoyl)glucosamine N-acyltransferase [Marinicauda salina]